MIREEAPLRSPVGIFCRTKVPQTSIESLKRALPHLSCVLNENPCQRPHPLGGRIVHLGFYDFFGEFYINFH